MRVRFLWPLGLLAPLSASTASADVLSIDGTLNNVGGFDIGVVDGDAVEVDIDYDPSTPPQIPGFNGFQEAIQSLTITIPDAGITLTGTGRFVNSITLIDDSSGAVDSLSFSIDDVTGTTALGGETVTTLSIILQETLFGGPPDLLTTQTSLPTVPLDFDTTGTLIMSVGISLSGGLANNFTATSFDPEQVVPEPGGAAVWAAALAWLAGLRRFRRAADGVEAGGHVGNGSPSCR